MQLRIGKIWLILSLVILGLIAVGIFLEYENDGKFTGRDSLWASLTELEMETVNYWRQVGGLQRSLTRGSRGAEVRILQQTLALADGDIYPSHLVTGYYGPITERAVRQWQRRHDLPAVGRVGPRTRALLNNKYFSALCPEPEKDHSDKTLAPVSRVHGLPGDYIPSGLVNITKRVRTLFPTCLELTTAERLSEMFAAAERDGVKLAVSSGFRRLEIQGIIHRYFLEYYGEEAIDFSAQPGHSEHQLGTTVDLTGASIAYQPGADEFAGSREKEWLSEHAHLYGFALSYPKNSQDTTGYIYEPWHWRYVGRKHAEALRDSDLTLLEYLLELENRPAVNDLP